MFLEKLKGNNTMKIVLTAFLFCNLLTSAFGRERVSLLAPFDKGQYLAASRTLEIPEGIEYTSEVIRDKDGKLSVLVLQIKNIGPTTVSMRVIDSNSRMKYPVLNGFRLYKLKPFERISNEQPPFRLHDPNSSTYELVELKTKDTKIFTAKVRDLLVLGKPVKEDDMLSVSVGPRVLLYPPDVFGEMPIKSLDLNQKIASQGSLNFDVRYVERPEYKNIDNQISPHLATKKYPPIDPRSFPDPRVDK
jgi:hypothetical protein